MAVSFIFRLPTTLGQPSSEPYQKQLSPSFGGVIRPSPYARQLVPGLGGPCSRGGLPPSPASSNPASLPSITTLPGFSAARMAIENRTAPPVCSLPRPVPVPSSPSAAAAAAHWIQQQHQQQQEAQAAVAFNLQSQLQQFLANEKALAASQFLDPFGNAANPFLDLARMGHYPLGKKLFGCPQCRYMTDRKNNLKRHISTMHQDCDKALECCGVLFKNKASLRDHVLIFHSNGYMCRFCGRNFCRKALLKRHLTVHSGQKDYICSQCDYATSHKSNLERHKKVHERNGSDGSDSESVYTDKSTCLSSEPDRIQGTNRPDLLRSRSKGEDDENTEDDDDLNLSDIDVDNEDDSLIDVVDIDMVSGLRDNIAPPAPPPAGGSHGGSHGRPFGQLSTQVAPNISPTDKRMNPGVEGISQSELLQLQRHQSNNAHCASSVRSIPKPSLIGISNSQPLPSLPPKRWTPEL